MAEDNAVERRTLLSTVRAVDVSVAPGYRPQRSRFGTAVRQFRSQPWMIRKLDQFSGWNNNPITVLSEFAEPRMNRQKVLSCCWWCTSCWTGDYICSRFYTNQHCSCNWRSNTETRWRRRLRTVDLHKKGIKYQIKLLTKSPPCDHHNVKQHLDWQLNSSILKKITLLSVDHRPLGTQ